MRIVQKVRDMMRESRERIIKVMREREIKKVDLVLSRDEYAEANGPETIDEGYDVEYNDYVSENAPWIIYYNKHNVAIDYMVISVELVDDGNDPHFKLECENEYETEIFDDYCLAQLSMLDVYDAIENKLGIDSEFESVWVFTAEQAFDGYAYDTITEIFSTKEAAQKHLHDFVHDEEGELDFAEKHGWRINKNCADWFCAYEDGCYCDNHTEAYIEHKILNN